MRILLISQYFDPEPTLKGMVFAQGLAQRGHQVQVLTGFPNYPTGSVAAGYRLRPHLREVMEGVPVDRVWLYPSHNKSAPQRALNYASFALSATAWRLGRGEAPDVTWIHHPPISATLPAIAVRRGIRSPFILEIQDLWPESLTANGTVSDGRIIRTVNALVDASYRRAAGLVCIAPGVKATLQDSGVPGEKIHVIPNWADEDRLQFGPDDVSWADSLLSPQHFNVVYTGNIGVAQGLEAVVAALRIARSRVPSLRMLFVGGGVSEAELQMAVQDLPAGCVQVIPRQPMPRVAALLDGADAGLVHLRRRTLYESTIPSKTQAYLAAGLPVIMAVRGDAASLIKAAGAGLTAEPDDPESLAQAIEDMHSLEPQRRRQMGTAGRSYYEMELSVDRGLDKYEALFDSVRVLGK